MILVANQLHRNIYVTKRKQFEDWPNDSRHEIHPFWELFEGYSEA